MKITLVISSLGCGGAERVLVLLAKGLMDRGHDISVVTLSDKTTDFYQLPEGCVRLDLGIMNDSTNIFQGIINNIKRAGILRKAIQSTAPDVVISFLRVTNTLTTLALRGTKALLILTEHNDLRVFSYGLFWETLRKIAYPLADKVVSVSKGVDESLSSLPQSKRAIIYNPILVNDSGKIDPLPPEVDFERKWLVSMGRMAEQKGFDLLLQAFAKIAPQYPDWQLIILGKGALKEQLEKMRDDLGLSGRVVFTGALSNPFTILKRSKIFVMASRNEGFPMAHGEALACGLPVISTDCPSGPREMIRHEVDGLLVANGDIDAVATAMASLMSDETKRQKLAAKAPEVMDRFGIEAIAIQWETLIDELMEQK